MIKTGKVGTKKKIAKSLQTDSKNPSFNKSQDNNKQDPNKNLSITFKKNGRVKVNLKELFDPTNKGGIEE